MTCLENWKVVQDRSQVSSDEETTLVEVSDKDTRPGYLKLQLFKYGQPAIANMVNLETGDFKLDVRNRVVLCRKISLEKTFGSTVHGPASTFLGRTGFLDHDFVTGYCCFEWPHIAKKWLTRPRIHNWPSKEVIEEMASAGHFIVPVGHYDSLEYDKEWRISPSLQERLLMHNLNPTQQKCYVLLKMIKKDLISSFVKIDSISSYHCKTCLFYMIENTPAHFWTPENLLGCLQACLLLLFKCVVEGACPNYFIPEENMFERRNFPQIQAKLSHVLWKLLNANCNYLIHIKCDQLGKMLVRFCSSGGINETGPLFQTLRSAITLYTRPSCSATFVRNYISKKCLDDEISVCVVNHIFVFDHLRAIEKVTVHTDEETKRTLLLILPHIQLSHLSQRFIRHAKQQVDSETALKQFNNKGWSELSSSVVGFSSTLKQATFLHTLGYYSESLALLEAIEKPSDDVLMSVCSCNRIKLQLPLKIFQEVTENHLTKEEAQTKYFVPCTVFLPTEKELVPTPLVHEMKRSSNQLSSSRQVHLFWYDWAVVDSKFLYYFLLYLNHVHLQMVSLLPLGYCSYEVPAIYRPKSRPQGNGF